MWTIEVIEVEEENKKWETDIVLTKDLVPITCNDIPSMYYITLYNIKKAILLTILLWQLYLWWNHQMHLQLLQLAHTNSWKALFIGKYLLYLSNSYIVLQCKILKAKLISFTHGIHCGWKLSYMNQGKHNGDNSEITMGEEVRFRREVSKYFQNADGEAPRCGKIRGEAFIFGQLSEK